MVLKSCRRFLIFCLSFISYSGFSQLSTKIKSNTDCCPPAVENKNATDETGIKIQIPAATNNLFQSLGIGLAALPSLLSKLSGSRLENYLSCQFKYAILMNATVEKLTNISLYKGIDEWFGTRYRYGGTTHSGIDCSAFMQKVANYAFGWALPRTAREQFALMQPVCREDIHEGDFVFFNTHGGVSHVGMYLQNNKFVHSSTSNGVMISDLSDKYWGPKIIGFKRMENHNTSMN